MIENSILDAGNHNWVLRGMSLLAKCIYGLALEAFLLKRISTLEFTQLRTLTDQRDNSASKKPVEDLSQRNVLSDHSNFIKEKVLSNGNSSAKASSRQSTAT